jgi:hypothetical protein
MVSFKPWTLNFQMNMYMEGLNLGVCQNGIFVGDVMLPTW